MGDIDGLLEGDTVGTNVGNIGDIEGFAVRAIGGLLGLIVGELLAILIGLCEGSRVGTKVDIVGVIEGLLVRTDSETEGLPVISDCD